MTETLVQVGLGMAGAFGTAVVGLLWKLVTDVAELNKNIAVVVVRVDSHEGRLDRLEEQKEN